MIRLSSTHSSKRAPQNTSLDVYTALVYIDTLLKPKVVTTVQNILCHLIHPSIVFPQFLKMVSKLILIITGQSQFCLLLVN